MAVTARADAGGVDITRDGVRLARYVAFPETAPGEAPRPYVHPLTTVGGTEVTDFRPEDHRWHHGLSLAIPFVGDANLWGGGTWDADAGGYLMKGDNGRQITETLSVSGGRIDTRLTWSDAAGRPLATEVRILEASEPAEGGWMLRWSSAVTASAPLAFGSPATRGRAGAGYGGIFLRAAPAFRGGLASTDRVPSADADALLGATARRVAFTRPDGAATIAIGTDDAATEWFVRSQEYPGLGPAPFSTRELNLVPGETTNLAATVWIVDGVPDAAALEHVFSVVGPRDV